MTNDQSREDGQRAAVRLARGQVIAGTRYRVTNWLGDGGVGAVYSCEHVDSGRRAALKVLHAEASASLQSPPDASSLRVDSPYVVEVHERGELRDGRIWFAMELLAGTTLASHLEAGPIGPGRALWILRQICKGLGSAHQNGIVHRDVEPRNVMLVRDGRRDDGVKILDVGVAAMLGQAGVAHDLRTGTPHYMAPEQTDGRSLDARVDVYAVGCVAYHMLTGRTVFRGQSRVDVLRAQRGERPLRCRDLPDAPAVPRPLEDVVIRCLAKDPAGRYSDMSELEAALCEAQLAARIGPNWDDVSTP